MPFVSHSGTRIYYTVEGSGEPLVLMHGFSADHSVWREYGFVDALRPRYQLILMDARGHGRSDKPHDVAAYTGEQRLADLIAVLDAVGVARAHYWGYSMGGRVGWACATQRPERLTSLVIGGFHPFARDLAEAQRIIELVGAGMPALVARFEQQTEVSPQQRARLLDADPDALIALQRASMAEPGYADALAGIEMPCLLYGGERDPITAELRRAAEMVPHATFEQFPELGHMEAGRRSDLVAPVVSAFLARHASSSRSEV